MKKVTVRDVANAAGVSISTASRALSGHPKVNPEMAKRVLEARDKLGYRTNILALALRTQRTGTYGVLMPSISNPYFVNVIEALENAFDRAGLSMILCHSQQDVEIEARRIETLTQHMVDGLVIDPVKSTEFSGAIRQVSRSIPVVIFDRKFPVDNIDFVGSNDELGITTSVNHLLEQGCKSITYIGSIPDSSTSKERVETFRSLMSKRPEIESAELLGSFSAQWGTEAIDSLLVNGALPDGIVCGADVIAIAVLDGLNRNGINVPNDVKVIGYDGIWLAELLSPGLSTIVHPLDKMADEAVQLLLSRQEDVGMRSRQTIFDPELVVRGSTKAN